MAATSRRAMLWAVPAVGLAATAPAYATSTPTPSCTPAGFKYPGQSHAPKSWTYTVVTSCTATVGVVTIDGRAATRAADGTWSSAFTDSRAHRDVQILDEHGTVLFSGSVRFRPIQQQLGGAA